MRGSNEERLIARVQKGARTVNLEFDVVSVEPGKVVLDLGMYIIGDSMIARYKRLAKQNGITLTILRDTKS